MRTILLGVLLACCFPISVIANDRSVIQSFLADLDLSIDSLVNRLQAARYTERFDSAFQQAKVRVFVKAETGGRPVTYIMEQCNGQVTGFAKVISSADELLLLNALKRQGYKKHNRKNGETYQKGTITIKLYNDDSRPLLAKRYIHVSRKSTCYQDKVSSPLGPELNLRPYSLEEALANLKYNRTHIALAAAKGAFESFDEKDKNNVVTYKRPLQSFRIQYCHNQVQHFEIELNSAEGRGLVASLEKMNFQKLKEETTDNNAYTRLYASDIYDVTVYYYGDKYGREFNENAYRIILYNKNTCI